jgi:hypothetical protein
MSNAIRLQKTTSDTLYISMVDNKMLTLDNESFNLTETILQVIEDTRIKLLATKRM